MRTREGGDGGGGWGGGVWVGGGGAGGVLVWGSSVVWEVRVPADSLAAMRIARVAAYRQQQPFRDGTYTCRNQSADGYDSTIVLLESDDGLVGAGEMAPLGAFYAPAFAAGTRAGVAELAPLLLGADPREPGRVRRSLEAAMLGQPNVKSALDMAVHDLAAQAAGVPLCSYLGGRHGTAVELYRSVSQARPR